MGDQTPGQSGAAPVEMKGTIRISGAWALYPMMVRWAEEYQKIHPQVRIDTSAGGAGKGAADALAGLVDIGMVSREIKKAETDQGGFFVPVVKDAVFPTINEQNPAAAELLQKGLKKATSVDLWMKGKKMTWGEAAGTGAKEAIRVYTRSDSCGAAETWAKYLGGAQEDLQGVAVYGDPGVAEAVRKDRFGFGYNNLNFAYDAKGEKPVEGLRVVPIDVNENGKVDPEEDLATKSQAIKAITTGVYPSPPARDLNLITRGRFKGPAKAFVEWILGEGQKFVGETGYIPLASEQLDSALKKARQ
jgi:phosphate transport system substrate-binding protein